MLRSQKSSNTFKSFRQQHKERQKQEGYFKDLHSLLKEPTKGNAIRIISKRVLQYLYNVGGGPGIIIKALYGEILDHFIDALYFYDKEIAVKEKLEMLVKNGKEAKLNSEKGLNALLEENVFIRNKHMPTVWQYCFLLGTQDPQFAKSINNHAFRLQENTKRRIKNFDNDIIAFLAVDNFIRSISPSIKEMKKELQNPSNAIENGFRALNLHAIELISLDTALHNFNGGLGRNIDKYIKMRNDWASWIDIPAITRPMYEEGKLPDLNFN